MKTSLSIKNYEALQLLKCFAGSVCIAICSQICVPFVPVPFTMQTLAVLFVASSLGARYGIISVLMYLAEGAIGLPVFAKCASGLPHLLGPTGGYLIGFTFAAYLIGTLIEKFKAKSFLAIFGSGLAGEVVLFLIGYLQLACFVGFTAAFKLGVVPFLLGDFVKVLLFALIMSGKRLALGR
ncbi:MAG: biotin transporter BioY [Holosporales bacterium]|jgi:biotin transport system substrate-specific component|nr:biotin transporter BioY [Holosporales bacterium]